MKGDRYNLHFGSLKLGMVTETDSDFPNLWGDIVYDRSLAEPRTDELFRLARFVALNREATRLTDLEDEPSMGAGQESVIAERDTQYTDYIESDDWHLIDEQGRELPILCPILRGTAEIVWRWNPGQG